MQKQIFFLALLLSLAHAGFLFSPSWTDLQDAIKSGDVKAVQQYITDGGNVDTKDHDGNPPLAQLLEYPNEEILNLLIKANADVNAYGKTSDCGTAQSIICKTLQGQFDLQFASKVITAMINVGVKESSMMCLGPLSDRKNPSWGRNPDGPNMLSLIVSAASNANHHINCLEWDSQKRCKKYKISEKGRFSTLIPDFLPLWGKSNAWGKYKNGLNGETKKRADILSTYGERCDKQSEMCEFAVYKQEQQVVFDGLYYKSETNYEKNKKQEKYSLQSWSCKDCYEIEKMFHDAKIFDDTSGVLSASKNYDEYIINYAKLLWNSHLKEGKSHLPMLELMIKEKAVGNDLVNKALLSAAKSGQTEIVQLMIKNGADVTTINTAFLSAAKSGQKEIAQFMIKNGADVTTINKALDNAAKSGQKEIVQLMIENGADVTTKALLSAAKSGLKEIVQFMIKNGADVTTELLSSFKKHVTVIKKVRSKNKNLHKLNEDILKILESNLQKDGL